MTTEPRKAVVEAAPSGDPDAAGAADIDILVPCSSGTYVRAPPWDPGRALDYGAYLTVLRRIAVGLFDIDGVHTLADLSARVETGTPNPELHGITTLPLEGVARRCLECLSLTGGETRALHYGRPLDAEVLERTETPEGQRPRASAKTAERRVVAGLASGGHLVALSGHQGSRARPVLVPDLA